MAPQPDRVLQQLPLYPLEERTENGERQVYDPLRRKWMVWSPEEHVRQCLIQFLTQEGGYPPGLLGVERGMRYNQLRKRWDLLVHDRNGRPLILAECKEPRIEISSEVVMQLATYNSQVGAPHLLITNGKLLLFLSRNESGEFALRERVPAFEELIL